MSYSANKRDALDRALPIKHRLSRLRSCAVLVSEKWKCPRSAILEAIKIKESYDMGSLPTEEEMFIALKILDDIKINGPKPAQQVDAPEPATIALLALRSPPAPTR